MQPNSGGGAQSGRLEAAAAAIRECERFPRGLGAASGAEQLPLGRALIVGYPLTSKRPASALSSVASTCVMRERGRSARQTPQAGSARRKP